LGISEEVIKLNRKLLVLIATLMILAMLATPALAKTAQKVSFTATQVPNRLAPPQGEDYRIWDTEGGTHHVRNGVGAGTITLMIEGQDPMPGTTSSEVMMNTRVDAGGVIKFDMTWTFEDGEFEGNIVGMITSPVSIEATHGVLQGTGAYKGWTVLLDGYVNMGPFTWSGTIVMPK
jgi:hypothetical protein